MAPKMRRQEDEALPAAKVQRGGNDRAERFASCLAALNGQFASWVAKHKELDLTKFWIEGARDYVVHATKLLDEYKDLLPTDGVATLQHAAASASPSPGTVTSGFGAPGGLAGGSGPLGGSSSSQPASSGKSSAPATGFLAPPAPAPAAPALASSLFGAAPAAKPSTGGFSFGTSAVNTTADGAAGAKENGAAAGAGTATAAAKEAAPPVFSFGTAAKDTSAGADASKPAVPAFTFGAASAPASGTSLTGGFAFGAAPASASAAASSSAAAASSGAAPTGALAGSIFGTATTTSSAPAFSFGVACSTTPAGDAAAKGAGAASSSAASGATGTTSAAPATGFFSFGSAASAAAGGLGSTGTTTTFGGFGAPGSAPAFSFGAPAAATAGGGGGADGEEGGEAEAEQDECDKEPSLTVDENVEFLFKEKARLQVPVKGPDGKIASWEARGTGTLSIRRNKAEGSKPYVALFTDSGRCLYQAYFNKTMKVVVSDKQKSVAFTAAWSPDGTSPPALHPALFQFGKGKNQAFNDVIVKLQGEMTE